MWISQRHLCLRARQRPTLIFNCYGMTVCKAALRGNVVWTASKVFFSSEMLRCYNYKCSGPNVIVILVLNFIWLSKVSLTLYKALPPSWSNIKPDFLPLPHMTLNMTLLGTQDGSSFLQPHFLFSLWLDRDGPGKPGSLHSAILPLSAMELDVHSPQERL